MNERPAEAPIAVPSPVRRTVPTRIDRNARADLRALRQLAAKAWSYFRRARGLSNKREATAWIARKALERIRRRLGTALTAPAAQTTRASAIAAQRGALSALLDDEAVLPTCVSAGGGAILVCIAENTAAQSILLRDEFGNLHVARILDQHPLRSRAGDICGTCLVAEAPGELLVGKATAKVDVLVRTSDEQFVLENITLQSVQPIVIRKFEFENTFLRFIGEFTSDSPGKVALGLFVDGELRTSCVVAPKQRRLAGTIALDHCDLDGRLHLIELRELPGLSVVGSLCQSLPLYLTPWTALQRYARTPLDGTLAPQARHFLRSYHRWVAALQSAAVENLPPLDHLYSELCQGPRKRPDYPNIQFDRVTNPTVTIVIPARNNCEFTYLCLCAVLFAFNRSSFEIIVVDDASTDETRRLEDFVTGIEIVRLPDSRGFVGACNSGAARARGEFLVLLNNDAQPTAGWLDELVDAFRNFDRVGLAGSKLVYPDGRLQEAGGIIWGTGNPWNTGRGGSPDDPRYMYLRKADYVSGAALMVPRDLWRRLGGFSVEFAPAYFEDTDFAMKVRENGLFVVFVPTSMVYHYEGRSSGTNVATGAKSFQEVNRPKFHKKWKHAYSDHAKEGHLPDREKDRDVGFRTLFVDHQVPLVDMDAGSYAAFQEMRLLQSLGAKVTFLPRNLAWMDRHTIALQRIGVECQYAPFVANFFDFLRNRASEYDLVYVSRHKIAEQVLPVVRSASPRTKVVFNLADLHFLREFREAAANSPGYSRMLAEATRKAELSVIRKSDLTFSYSDVELEILRRYLPGETRLARMPWVVECHPRRIPFMGTHDILFLGGFGHHPNVQAARFFARNVMPRIRNRLPGVIFNVIGRGGLSTVAELNSGDVRVFGYVADLTEYFEQTRIFVAPLLAGAGLKGKVLDAISHGVPCVLSSVAAEGTGLTDGVDCLIAASEESWADYVAELYTNRELWNRLSRNAFKLAAERYSFGGAVDAVEASLARIGLTSRREWGLAYRHARPQNYGY